MQIQSPYTYKERALSSVFKKNFCKNIMGNDCKELLLVLILSYRYFEKSSKTTQKLRQIEYWNEKLHFLAGLEIHCL